MPHLPRFHSRPSTHGYGDALQSQRGEEGRIRRVEQERDIFLRRGGQVGDRERRVAERLDGLRFHGRQVNEVHAQVGVAGFVALGVAAVHRHLVAAVGEASTDLFDGGLETAVGRGYAAGAEHGDSQCVHQ